LNRDQFRQLAADRVVDAQALLASGSWSAAYYLAGYAVECGLKACILGFLEANPDVIFRDKRYQQERCWTHDIEKLVTGAGLVDELTLEIANNADLGANWQAVKDWNEECRYRQFAEADARQMLAAIDDPLNGVLQWIKARW
jgi:HEPN domain-containing protein